MIKKLINLVTLRKLDWLESGLCFKSNDCFLKRLMASEETIVRNASVTSNQEDCILNKIDGQ